MTRLINADDFIEKLAHVPMVQEAIKKAMDTMPTVDAVPVVHGRWIAHTMSEITGYDPALSGDDPVCSYSCSVCGEDCYVSDTGDDILSDYCPHCGARLDGERKEG